MQNFCSCGKWYGYFHLMSLFSNDQNSCSNTITLVITSIHKNWFFLQYQRSNHQSENKTDILKQIAETVKHRKHIDGSVELIGVLLYGPGKGSSVLQSVRAPGSSLVDDWTCLKSMVIIKNWIFLFLLTFIAHVFFFHCFLIDHAQD